MLEYKSQTLATHGATATATLREVAIDLRQDWPTALRAAGFDPTAPTAWLAEGLLMYLPAEAQDTLFTEITALSAPGSRVSAEAIGHRDEERREQMRMRWEKMADEIGLERPVDISDLTYNDSHRADLTEWLGAHGWIASGRKSTDEMRSLNRWVEWAGSEEQDTFSTFVVAERIAGR